MSKKCIHTKVCNEYNKRYGKKLCHTCGMKCPFFEERTEICMTAKALSEAMLKGCMLAR